MDTDLLAPPRTVADVLRDLGDIQPHRVRWNPLPGTATIEDLLRSENKCCELIDGTLVEKAMGFRESVLALFLGELIGPIVRKQNLGIISGEDGPYELITGLVRKPDIAYISWDRLPNRRLPDKPISNVIPDLAVEVLSLSNTKSEMSRKRREYFKAGVIEVWEIDPRARTVRVYAEPKISQDFTATDTLSTHLLPGLTISLAELFAELDRHG